MNSKMWKVMLLVAAITGIGMSATYTVSKPGGFGAYNKIMDAIKIAKDGDEVVIVDYGVYEEQVDIYNLKDFTLRSENPTSLNKPKIVYRDTKNINPKNVDEAQDSATINYDQNGALRVWQSYNITIEGIAVSGEENFYFGYPSVWKDKGGVAWPLQHGNVGIVIRVAGKVTVRHCDISDAFFGLYIKDRNEGGIFANSNPADIQTWKVVPLSGFGRTGDHLIEHNRIHDNSFGMFFESNWDLGSVVRYNLIYENHHPEGEASKIKGLTSEGGNLTGGAILFKDHIISPLTIHNNTFWHNTYSFVGAWRSGGHYLIFNNIVGEPYLDGEFKDAWQCLDPYFSNRMYHCVYASHIRPIQIQKQSVQAHDPKTQQAVVVNVNTYQVRIMNSFGDVQGTDLVVPITLTDSVVTRTIEKAKLEGNLCIGKTAKGGYDAINNIRWLETKFKSTNPADAEFLEPDWDDSLVNRYIVDQGYPAVGIVDPDGSPADLGAIPKAGGYITNLVRITPTSEVIIKDNTASVGFTLSGNIVNPVVKYAKWINELPVEAEMGQSDVLIPASDIIDISSITSVKPGYNLISFPVPARGDDNLYGYLEIFVEGKDPVTGEKVVALGGTLPYRKIDYQFDVLILDNVTRKPRSEVAAGEVVNLFIQPRRLDGTEFDPNTPIDKIDIRLSSPFQLLDATTNQPLVIPGFKDFYETTVKFTRVPDGGVEIVSARGLFSLINGSHKDTLPISGTSEPVRVKAGPPDSLSFSSPPSGGVDKIDPGKDYDVKILVFDMYGNRVDQQTDVTLTSTIPEKADIVGGGPKTSKTDSTGVVYFKVEVTTGTKNDTIPLVATLVANSKTDNAKLVVGEARDKLVIFFADDSAGVEINEALTISGCSDKKIPVVIKRIGVINDTKMVMAADSDSVAFDIEKSSGLGIYATSDPNDLTVIRSAKIKNGQITLWIKATGLNVSNGRIKVYPVGDPSVLAGERGGITFNPCNPGISSAAYFADSGDGLVNRLEIYYEDTLSDTEIPDTFQLYWPHTQGVPKIVLGNDLSSVTLDQTDKKHITIRFLTPFNPEPFVTMSYVDQLGKTIWKNPLLPEAPAQITNFNIQDSVGPLLTSAVLVENLNRATDDTLFVTFSEIVDPDLIIGTTLRLSQKNSIKKLDLQIKQAASTVGDTIRIIVASLGTDSISEGDSLSIIPEGTIRDEKLNKAHEKNRPVIIRLKSISPSIISSAYRDLDGNGIVDLITVTFNKKVVIDSLHVKFTWSTDGLTTGEIKPEHAKMVYGADSQRVLVDVSGLFAGDNPRTTGAMTVDATYLNYDYSISSWTVDDSAAPVVLGAMLYPGSIGENDSLANLDTLVVKFSEHINSAKVNSLETMFFTFYHDSVTLNPYSMLLTKHKDGADNEISFIVKSMIIADPVLVASGFNFPKNRDLFRMDTGYFIDDNNNVQSVIANRTARLAVKAVPTIAQVKAGPNPFNLERGDSVTIIVKPKAKMVENVKCHAKVIIYDKLGNVVFTKEGDNNSLGFVELSWKGYNKNGKKVSLGTYLAKVRYTLEVEDEGKVKTERKEVTLKIGAGKKYVRVGR